MKIKNNLFALAVIIIVGFILKITFLFADDVWRIDLYYYIEFARTMLDGGVLYKNFGCSHPPLGYFEFYWMAKFFGYDNMYLTIKIVAIVIQTITAYVVYLTFSKLWNHKTGLLYSILFLIMIAININFWPHNIPLTFLLPTFCGIYFLVKDDFTPTPVSLFFFGFFIACATLISTNVIFYSLLVPLLTIKNFGFKIKNIIIEGIVAFAGFILPFALFFIYFASHNALIDWYFWNIGWAAIYSGYKPWYVKLGHLVYGMIQTWQWIPFFLAAFYGIYISIKNKTFKTNKLAYFAICIFALSLICKGVMNKPHPRYYLYMLPGLFFAVSYTSTLIPTNRKKIIYAVLSIFMAGCLIYTNMFGWKLTRSGHYPEHADLRAWLIANVEKTQTIWIWEEGYEIYYDTRLKRAKNAYFAPGEDLDKSRLWRDNKYKDTAKMWQRFLVEFTQSPPDYIVDITPNFEQVNLTAKDGVREGPHKLYYDKFREFVDKNYKVIKLINKDQRILKRI